MQVFVSYSSADDQVTALRLQTLAAAHGLQVYVPPAHTRLRQSGGNAWDQVLRQSDLVLAVITGSLAPGAQRELELAAGLKKKVLPIVTVESALSSPVVQRFPQAFYLDPMNPAAIENDIIGYLNQLNWEKQQTKALIALSVLAIGLLLLPKE